LSARSIAPIKIANVTDVPSQFSPLVTIWSSCIEELRPLNRVVAKGIEANTREAFEALPEQQRPNLWGIAELPVDLNPPPAKLVKQIADGAALCVAEEHVAQGSVAAQLAYYLALQGVPVRNFKSMHARAHVYERYGSQQFLRARSQLDVPSMLAVINA